MKKILITLLFIVGLANSSQAQIMLGYSIKDVKEILDRKGYIVRSGYTKQDSIYYVTAEDNLLYRVYYFSPYNECMVYVLFLEGTEEDLIKNLIKQDYYKIGDTFYNDECKVTISYDSDVELYYYTWTFKQPK